MKIGKNHKEKMHLGIEMTLIATKKKIKSLKARKIERNLRNLRNFPGILTKLI